MAPESAPHPSRWRQHLVPFAGYLVLTAVALWPAVAHFRSRMLSEPSGDSSVFTWAWWALPRALGRGESPWSSDLLFHPVGVDLSLTTTAPLVGLATWPVRETLGPIAQVNVVQLGAFLLTAWFTYLLALRVVHVRSAAWVAGAAFAAAPYRWAQLPGHLNLIHTWCIPLGALALLRFIERPDGRRAAALGASVGIVFLLDPQLCVMLLLVLVCVGAARWRELRVRARVLAIAGATALFVAAPLLVPMVVAMGSQELNEAPDREVNEHFSATVTSWVIPTRTHPLFGEVARRSPTAPTREAAAAPGLLLLALAIAGRRIAEPKARRGWVAVAVVGVLLSLGPYAHLPGGVGRVPLPYQLLRLVPGLGAHRVPGRFAIVGVFGVAMLAAGTIAGLVRRHPDRARVFVPLIALVAGIELLHGPLPEGPGEVPRVYEVIADDDGDGAVLELPLQWLTGEAVVGDDDMNHSVFLHYATVHGRPLVNGSASRYPDRRLDELRGEPVYRQLLRLEDDATATEPLTFDADDLRDLGIGYVVYHRDRPLPAAWEHLQSLGLPVLADDGTIVVWRVPA